MMRIILQDSKAFSQRFWMCPPSWTHASEVAAMMMSWTCEHLFQSLLCCILTCRWASSYLCSPCKSRGFAKWQTCKLLSEVDFVLLPPGWKTVSWFGTFRDALYILPDTWSESQRLLNPMVWLDSNGLLLAKVKSSDLTWDALQVHSNLWTALCCIQAMVMRWTWCNLLCNICKTCRKRASSLDTIVS